MINVRDFGACGDGGRLDHPAIQQAIDRASGTGGGTVLLPPGRYRCGTIHLRSGVSLHLPAGATILAADDPRLFPPIDVPTPSGDTRALIHARDACLIAIHGEGAIDAGGADAPSDEGFHPATILLRDCDDVRLEGVRLLHARFWTVHLLHCRRVACHRLAIRSLHPNGDGIDPDGCAGVLISDCDIDSSDDSIVLKSTLGRACEDVLVSNCLLRSRHATLKLGTESVGPIRNVVLRGCVCHGGVGLGLYMKDGGAFENVLASDLLIESDAPFPLLIDATPRDHGAASAGRIRGVSLRGLRVVSPGRILIEARRGDEIEELSLTDVSWRVERPFDRDAPKPAGTRRHAPAPDASALRPEPYHLLASHVRGLRVERVDVRFASGLRPDRGPALLRDAPGASVDLRLLEG